MQVLNADGLIDQIPRTDAFTRMVTDAAADSRKWVVLLEEFQCFAVFTGMDQGNESLNADMGRTDGLAGCCAPFRNGKSPGNRLCILFESRLSGGQRFVVFIWNADGADFGTFPAACAFGKIDEPGLLADMGRKTAGIAAEFQKLGLGE